MLGRSSASRGRAVPRASCCTYQLPPGGEFARVVPVIAGTAASVELTVLGEWETWVDLDPAIATVSNASVQADRGFGGPVATGRVSMNQLGPFNVWVGAYRRRGPSSRLALRSASLDAGLRAFEVQSFGDRRGPYTLLQAIAYPTTVEGA